MMMMKDAKIMKAAADSLIIHTSKSGIFSSTNKNLAQRAAFFHSTPPLSLSHNNRTYWGKRDHRGQPGRYKNFHKGYSNPLVKQLVCDYYDYDAYRDEIKQWCGEDLLAKAKGTQVFTASHQNKFGSSPNYNWQNDEDQKKKTENSSNRQRSTSSSPSVSVMISERLALGLRATGPISLDEIKNAYLECAVKWHPDHHHGLAKNKQKQRKYSRFAVRRINRYAIICV